MIISRAYQHALKCGQIFAVIREQKEKLNCKELFSEDLWQIFCMIIV